MSDNDVVFPTIIATKRSIPADAARLFAQFSRRRQWQLALVFGVILMSAASEVVSIGLIVPFLAILLAPEQAMSNPAVLTVASWLNISTATALLLPLVVAFLCAILLAGLTRLLALYATARFSMAAGSELATRLLARTLDEPFVVHLSRHSSEVIAAATKKVDGVINGFLMPGLQFASSAIILAFIAAALLAIDPLVASVAFGTLGGAYILLSVVTRKTRSRISSQMRRDVPAVVKILTESLSGIRDIIMSRSQSRYVDEFARVDTRMRADRARLIFISQGARHIMEMVAIVLVVSLAYYIALAPGGAAAATPTLGALALGGQRMLPALQQMFASWNTMGSVQGYLDDLLNLVGPSNANIPAQTAGDPVTFGRAIELRHVSYRFPGGDKPVLDDVNIIIPKGTSVGIIGETGSGKSTLANILMGLLSADSGALLVDGVPITEKNVNAWRDRIACVPQSIYLLDASFEENIAIGNGMAPLDKRLVRLAAEEAQIISVVQGRPEGFAASLGENGVQLSGGQRQRVGIARALYKRGDVLILDEATSALDHATEAAVMSAIAQSTPGATKIIIAHRLSTLRGCDLVVRMDHGRIARVGSFADVVGGAA
jgi:ABC-type bacteriocin/lantibiotic exporter with double-glycine peptidase domain